MKVVINKGYGGFKVTTESWGEMLRNSVLYERIRQSCGLNAICIWSSDDRYLSVGFGRCESSLFSGSRAVSSGFNLAHKVCCGFECKK